MHFHGCANIRGTRLSVSNTWPCPRHRDVGQFTSATLYADALQLLAHSRVIDEITVRHELGPRLKGLAQKRPRLMPDDAEIPQGRVSNRVASDLLREVNAFGWTVAVHAHPHKGTQQYSLSEEGYLALQIVRSSPVRFRRLVTAELHKRYVVPGWFVDRLWKINPRTGEVLLPGPPKDWQPRSLPWDENAWTPLYESLTTQSLETAQRCCAGELPISQERWIETVRQAWSRLSTATRKRKAAHAGTNERVNTYRPRKRLAMSMLEAAIELLFAPVPPRAHRHDIAVSGNRMYVISNRSPRTLLLWCARLEDLELLFYTDYVRAVPGRLLFPVSVFRDAPPNPDFELQESVTAPDGRQLFYHMPRWNVHRATFLEELAESYHRISRNCGALLYVSLLDVRDDVCRKLRMSASLFEEHLRLTFRELLDPDSPYSMSLDSNIREDQSGGAGLMRRPVWQDNVPYFSIAVAPKQKG